MWVSTIAGFVVSFWFYATRPVGIGGRNGAECIIELLDEVGLDVLRILWSVSGIPSQVRAECRAVLVSRPEIKLIVVVAGIKDVLFVLDHAVAQVLRLADIEDG